MTARKEDLKSKINELRMDLALMHHQFDAPNKQNQSQNQNQTQSSSSNLDIIENESDEELSLASSHEDKLIIISQKLKTLHRECDNLQNEIFELRSENSQIQKNLSTVSQKNEDYLKLKENYGFLQKSLNSSLKFREQQKAMITLLRSTIADNTKTSSQAQAIPKLEPNRQPPKSTKETNGNNPQNSLFDAIPSPLNMKLRVQGSVDESRLHQDKSRPPTKKRTDDSSKTSSSSQNHPHSPIHSSSRLKASSQPRQASHDGGTTKTARHHKTRSGKAFRPFQLQDHPYYKRNASSQPRQLPDSSTTVDNSSITHNLLSSSNSSGESSAENEEDDNNSKKHKPKGKKPSRVLSQSESRKIRPSETLGGTSGAH